MSEEKTCKECMYDDSRVDAPCFRCHDMDLWVKNPWTMIEELEDKIDTLELQLSLYMVESYLTYKTHITTSGICYNAESKLCVKCKQPECDLAGWEQPKGHISYRQRRQIEREDAEAAVEELEDE